MSERRLLLVDDDPGILRSLKWTFDNYRVATARDRESALAELRTLQPQVVTLDLGLPPAPDDATEGLKTLEEILAAAPSTKVIMVTGNDDRQHAVTAIGIGAYDFYSKPIDADILGLIVQRAFHVYDLEEENRRLAEQQNGAFHGIISASKAMADVCRTIEKVGPSDISVLLLGDSGTGKELLARALHQLSARTRGPFIAINCAAIPDNLLESELFGHEKGAFTGAIRQVKGKIELANGGTLFLDEIGDMPMPLQAKLLRFIQERVIERVGGREQIAIDTRVVCATHKDLNGAIKRSEFREDLFYRLSEMTIRIPPLRERSDDSVVLARFFADKFARDMNKKQLQLAPQTIAAIRRHPWSGNVRELENRMKRAVILAEGKSILPQDLDLEAPDLPDDESLTLKDVRERAEREALVNALAKSGDNLTLAAQLLGISRPTIYNLMRQHNIVWPPAGQTAEPVE
jgi:two-component system NtrC family response regulator